MASTYYLLLLPLCIKHFRSSPSQFIWQKNFDELPVRKSFHMYFKYLHAKRAICRHSPLEEATPPPPHQIWLITLTWMPLSTLDYVYVSASDMGQVIEITVMTRD